MNIIKNVLSFLGIFNNKDTCDTVEVADVVKTDAQLVAESIASSFTNGEVTSILLPRGISEMRVVWRGLSVHVTWYGETLTPRDYFIDGKCYLSEKESLIIFKVDNELHFSWWNSNERQSLVVKDFNPHRSYFDPFMEMSIK